MKKVFLFTIVTTAAFIYPKNELSTEKSKHIVYHHNYDITFFGLEKIHPFDSSKYGKVAQALIKSKILNQQDFYEPKEISDQELLFVHTQKYLDNIYRNASATFAKASEVSIFSYIPNFLIRWNALYPMRLATGGTVAAMELALQNKWAINLSGGYHHAKSNDCGGFCIYNDAAIAAYKAIMEHNINKILVVDLDAHQGNGNEEIFGNQPIFKDKVDVFDVYGSSLYPGPSERHLILNQKTWYNHPIELENATDDSYKALLIENLPEAIAKTKPELIIYNAGTDIYEKDPLGGMKITKQAIIDRDAYVFKLAQQHNIPIVMMLSGGYTLESSTIIADSIINILSFMKN